MAPSPSFSIHLSHQPYPNLIGECIDALPSIPNGPNSQGDLRRLGDVPGRTWRRDLVHCSEAMTVREVAKMKYAALFAAVFIVLPCVGHGKDLGFGECPEVDMSIIDEISPLEFIEPPQKIPLNDWRIEFFLVETEPEYTAIIYATAQRFTDGITIIHPCYGYRYILNGGAWYLLD